MDSDFIERHAEKWMIYIVFFVGGFAFGVAVDFITSIQSIFTIQLFHLITDGLVWGTSGAFFALLFVEVHHRKWDR